MLENDIQFEDLINKLSNDEIPLSDSEINKIAYYLLSKKEIPSLQLMKFLGVHNRLVQLQLQRLEKKIEGL